MADSTRPTWTNGTLTASAVGTTTLTLTWSGAGDDTAVSTYKVYRGSSEIAEVSAPTVTYDATGLRAGKTYTFSVEAVDAAENKSIDGPSVQVRTLVANYAKIDIAGIYSKSSNYSDPKIIFKPSPYTTQPTEFIKMTVEGEISVGSDVDTSMFTSISFVMIKNLDTAQTLQVVLGNAAHDNPGGGYGFTTRVAPGGVFVTTDAIAAGKINVGEVSGSGDGPCMCEVFVAGY